MPIYDVTCWSCKDPFSFIASYDEYDRSCAIAADPGSVIEGEDELVNNFICPHCGSRCTQDNREISRSIQKIVIGVSKGNYNGRDYS